MAVYTITEANFEEEVLKSDKPVLIDFWASWCGPCRMQSPIVDKLASAREDIKVGKVNVDDESELASRFNIVSIPTILIFKGGQVVNQVTGVTSQPNLEKMLDA